MKTFRHIKKTALVLGLVVCTIPILIGLATALGLTSPSKTTFYRNYKALKIGMPKAEIQALFGKTPTYSCRYSASEIWYYAAPGLLTEKFPDNTPEQGMLHARAADLPDVYGHIQLAFNSNDELIAFTFIGESYTAEWQGGSVKGTHFKHLPRGSL